MKRKQIIARQKEVPSVDNHCTQVQGIGSRYCFFLDDDFDTVAANESKDGFPPKESGEQEINLLYVAITRTRKLLFVNNILRDWMKTEEEFQKRMSE